MSHPFGKDLGGVRTLAGLLDRCWVCPETGCWRWRMHQSQGAPRVHVVIDGHADVMRGRKAAVLLSGRRVPNGWVCYPTKACHHSDCVNPEHARCGTKACWGAYLAHTGRSKTAAKTAANRRRQPVEHLLRHTPVSVFDAARLL